MGDANNGQRAAGDFHGWRVVYFPKTKGQVEGFRSFLAHKEMNFDQIFKAERLLIIAFGVNTRPAQARIRLGHDNREAKRAIEPMLGSLHEPEEIGEVHDPS